ncbi:MAG TPA: sugar phosphate nucleotidyltransferase [Candidatus Saccharimonadales bacterium]|nr:sugar phosphate nucleotidyltransferase [Candidatus Saccharimonadales bacterium]
MAPSKPCTKAVIAVAGFGTRRLPITKAIEKSMLPVGNRPVIDYIVEDCIRAGITDITFVVGEQSQQIHTYYGHNVLLEEYLAQHGKNEMLAEVQKLSTEANFRYVVQDQNQPYGTSIPIWLARDFAAADEPFLYLYGDNIFYNQDGSSAVADFVRQAMSASTPGAMMTVEVPMDQVSQYGIVASRKQGDIELYEKIVEKPKPEEAPSNLNNAGCFMIRPDIMPYVERSILHAPQIEKYFIDALNWYVKDGNDIAVVRTKAEFLDCGNVTTWLHANNRILSK